jgi:hypothetical protein
LREREKERAGKEEETACGLTSDFDLYLPDSPCPESV